MPEMPGTLHNWSTAEPYIKSGDVSWIADPLDKLRIGAYTFYDSVFRNAPDTWAVVMYETNRRPLYIPSAKILINAINRYVAPNMEVVVDQQALLAQGGTLDPNQPDPAQAIRDLFHREMFYAKFAAEKRMGRVRGDWIFMIQGDELKVEGSRISLVTVDPGSYFPIWSEEDPDVRVGVHIVTQWINPGDDEIKIYRTTFRKTTPPNVVGGPGTITVEEAIFPLDEWGGPNMEEGESEIVKPLTPLDPRITEIPVYHMRPNHMPGEDYGTSDLSGLESMMVAVNQGASDEDIALALTGLGVYETDAGPPLDPTTGATLPWRIGPSRVVEVPKDHHFGRVQGITSVEPYQVHISYIDGKIAESMGLGPIAMGNVAVEEAESGIALALKLAPTISMAEEQELEINGKMRQMLHDLKAWLEVYEGIGGLDTFTFTTKYGDKIPVNRKQRVEELIQLFAANLVSGAYVRGQLTGMGYEMPSDEEMLAQIIAEKQSMQQIVSDVTGSRIDTELEDASSNGSS